ncbi:hydrolase [Rhizorhabdus dicambivorans]|uniref:Hydrolase n=1 Tax=Rhizorhabdus dicambivorans TaxID=1850238 RepID=A0A2A4FSJ5_9SPHN|nr:hydrolase [Rhizorhabdus dicambivorans]ATE66195.1 hydrolase [Rhizorhabdus dicambivorans]PCE41705.1 hydrolase [Rhizorhabdus dicambivorans]
MKTSVTARKIPNLLDQAPADVAVLSLDCFDTLLWRNAQAPSDVFAELGIEGGSIEPRFIAERDARKAEAFRSGRREVSIEAIHARLLPGADEAAIAASVCRELELEARHCFGFGPVIALIEAAKAKGLTVIIVSDSYLNADQLRTLIARAAGEPVAAMIDRVFTSSEHGMSKSEGLFGPVLAALGVAPSKVMHLGDNQVADQEAPAALGIHGVHFEQFDSEAETRLRHEAMAAVVLDSATRQTVPATQPHRPLLSLRDEQDPAFVLGHDVIGPIFHGFAEWVKAEVEALAARCGRPVKTLFLMRDGYLPMKLFETLGNAIPAGEVAISRLTAGRASLIDEAAIGQLVEREAGKQRFDVLAGMLLLEPHEARKLGAPTGDVAELEKIVCDGEAAQKVIRRSARYAERLIAHVRRAGVNDGDMVTVVDLGYHGTVQDRIVPLLKARMDVEVAGRYLLLRENAPTGLDKKGWFDKRHYGREALTALGSSIAVIEQICTQAKGSVVDYHPNGKPIHEKPGEKGSQSATRDRIQAGAIAYGVAATALGRTAISDDADCRRRAAAAAMARFMYLPSSEEVAVIGDFTHDANLGSSSHLKLLDGSSSTRGLRRRGLHYVQSTARMFLPGELQDQGLALNLALFGIVRGALDVRESDFQAGGTKLPVILANAREDCMVEMDAYPTHDGYHRLTIPARRDLTIAVLLGGLYEAVQIEDISFQPMDAPSAERGGPSERPDIDAPYVQEGMEPIAGDLFRCSEGAALLVPALPSLGEGDYKLCIAFRPVVVRATANEARKAA